MLLFSLMLSIYTARNLSFSFCTAFTNKIESTFFIVKREASLELKRSTKYISLYPRHLPRHRSFSRRCANENIFLISSTKNVPGEFSLNHSILHPRMAITCGPPYCRSFSDVGGPLSFTLLHKGSPSLGSEAEKGKF